MTTARDPGGLGFTLGAVGVAVYVVGTFLPALTGDGTGPNTSVTLALGGGIQPSNALRYRLASLLLLYGTAAVVGVISLKGLRRRHDAARGVALMAAAAIWFVPTLGVLIRLWQFPGWGFEGIGLWSMHVGQGVSSAGGVLCLLRLRGGENTEPRTSSTAVLGFVIGVLGVGLYVYATTLAYQSVRLPSGTRSASAEISRTLLSEFHQATLVGAVSSAVGLYGIPAVIGVICLGGVLGRREDPGLQRCSQRRSHGLPDSSIWWR